MEQFEKVYKGLEICTESTGYEGCITCPYHEDYYPNVCRYANKTDALALIRQQQERIKELEAAQTARVMSLEEIKDSESYWLSTGKEFVTRPVICVHREDDARKPYITFVWQFGTFSWDTEDYGKRWRCWTQRPTDEQRRATPWKN